MKLGWVMLDYIRLGWVRSGVGELFWVLPQNIFLQRYYPLDLKVRKNELIAFKIIAVQQLYKHFS
jgi:hypothetical protein